MQTTEKASLGENGRKLRNIAPKILVVDDERSIADTMRDIIELAGYVAVSSYSGEEAILKVEDFLPDVLISDVMMPGMERR